MRISGFFRCNNCNKLHTVGGLSATTKCSCGAPLYHVGAKMGREVK